MTNLEAFCVIAAGGAVGGLGMWMAWSLGFMSGRNAELKPKLRNSEKSDHRQAFVYTLGEYEETPLPPCRCGGLCPICALERKKK